MKETDIINEIVKSVKPLCADLHLTVDTDYHIRSSVGDTVSVDIVLLDQDNYPLAVFDVNKNLFFGEKNKAEKRQKHYLHEFVDNVGALIGFLTNGEEFLFIQPLEKSIFKTVDIQGVLDILSNIKDYAISNVAPNDLVEKLKSTLSFYITQNPCLGQVLEGCTKSLILNHNQFSLGKDDEMKFIKSIIEYKESHRLCRYTSINSLFRIINDKQDSMCGLAVMNDKSECYYLDKLLSRGVSSKLTDMSQAEIDELNIFFINSLCRIDKEDDLTMWRLYGGDGRGVCIEYEVLDEYLSAGSNFYLMNVVYIDQKKSSKALTIIRKLKTMARIHGYKFVFTQYDVWKHFFKPFDFSIEQEVRLLYQKPVKLPDSITEKWIYNGDYQITHPILVFNHTSQSEYPLVIKKIILGPKFSEMDTNVPQLKKLLREKGFKNVDVVPSKIDFYR